MKKQIFSRFLALVLTALMLVGVLPIAAWAGASDFSYYVSTNADGEYAVIDGYYGEGGTVVVPAEIDGLPVLQIAYGVFGSCESITHVTISEGIMHLSGNVFSWSSVKTVSLPSTLKTISSQCFYYSDLTEITIPAGVELLGSGLFEGCEDLTNVYVEAKEPGENWDESWADNCYADIWYDGVRVAVCVQDDYFLYRVQDNQATVLNYIGDYYAENVVVPETAGNAVVTAIGTDAFKDMHYVQEIELPETVTVIANNAFISCGSLEKVNLPLGLTYIGMQAFMWCGNLQELRIPETVTFIGSNAFYDGYATLYFEADAASENWDSYWSEYFYGSIVWGACMHRDVTVDEVEKTCETDGYRRVTCNGCGVEISYEFFALGHEYVYGICSLCGYAKDTWDDFVYYYDYYYGEDGTETSGVVISEYRGDEQYVLIPSELGGHPVIGIGSYAFEYNKTILGVQIPSSVKFIGYGAFTNTSLQTAELSDGVEQIIDCAFQGTPLQEINFPSTLKHIGDCSFMQTKLYRVDIPAGVTYVGNQAFEGCTSLSAVYCEAEAQPAGWNEYWDKGMSANVYFADRLAVMYYTENSTVYRIDIAAGDAADGVATLYDYNGSETVVEIPAYVGDWSVVKIGHEAFRYREVTSVTLPDSITMIDAYAFADCGSLNEVNIPDSVTEIGRDAFAWCYALTEITIPASVEVVGYDLFWQCNNLQNVYCEVSSKPDAWEEAWTSGCTANIWFGGVMHEGVIDGFRFVIADGRVVIKDYVGEETVLTVPSEISGYPVTELANGALCYLYDVTSITLPDTLVSIDYAAFEGCYSLTEITVPASVETMEYGVFWGCESLQNIYCEAEFMPEAWNEYWLEECSANVWFGGVLVRGQVDGYVFEIADGNAVITDYVGEETELAVPAELAGCPVTEIGAYAFADLYSVTSITLPDSVTRIGNRAFADCDSLASMIIPDSVTYIGGYAFAWCSGLTEITIPESVLEMEDSVFWDCYNLENIYCEADSRPEGWSEDWAQEYYANIWFDGVLMQGVIDGFRIKSENGAITIRGYEGDATEIVIPSELCGLPVTVIGSQAFSSLGGVTSIVIPDSVEHIYYEAFAYNENLTEITIPASVTLMSESIFYNCTNLQNIYCEATELPMDWSAYWANGCEATVWLNGVLYIGISGDYRVQNVGGEIAVLKYLGEVAEVVIPETIDGLPVVAIEHEAFSGCDWITDVVIPDSVWYLGISSFAGCTSLTEITIPLSVTYIHNYAFDSSGLQNIYCEAESQPINWMGDWAEGCNASVWFDGVLAFGVIDGFKVSVEDGGVAITDYVGDAAELVIPSVLADLPVVRIGGYAFSHRSFTSIVIPDSVTEIAYNAFSYNENLTEITIPAGVSYMGSYIFEGCSALQNVYCMASEDPENWDESWIDGCGASVYFDGELAIGVEGDYRIKRNETGITIVSYVGKSAEVVIPAELLGAPVTRIGRDAFDSCGFITSVVIPDTVTSIGYEAFAYCYGLTEITIPASVLEMDGDVFWDCYNLQNIYCKASARPEGWVDSWTNGCEADVWFDGVLAQGVIDGFKFKLDNGGAVILDYIYESEPVELVVPATLGGAPVTAIGSYAFAYLYELERITLPETVVTIGERAFYQCSALETVTLPAGVESIGSRAFAYCEALTEITIPASVTSVGTRAFYGAYALANIYCEASSQPNDWHSNWTYGCEANVWFDGVLTVGVIDGFRIETVGGEVYILGYVGNDLDVVIPAEIGGLPVTHIGADAFDGALITSVVIPDSVTSIGYEAFAYCYNLTEITIPASVVSMEGDVFWDCQNLQNVYCESATIPEQWGESWMNGCDANIWFGGTLKQGVIGNYQVVINDGQATILLYLGTETEIVVPAELGGFPVEAIGSHAFMGCEASGITLPEGLISIGTRAFAYCNNLTELTIPASVAELSSEVFYASYGLENIYFAEGMTPDRWADDALLECMANVWIGDTLVVGVVDGYRVKIFDSAVTVLGYLEEASELIIPELIGGMPVTVIGSYAFANRSDLTSVVLPASVKRIEEGAFSDIVSLQTIQLNEGLETICVYAFIGCESLTEITIPESVESMERWVFDRCYALENIYCETASLPDAWHVYWTGDCEASVWFDGVLAQGVIDGIRVRLEDGAFYTVYGYVGESANVVIPAEIGGLPVTHIGADAFDSCDWITSLIIPDSITYIGYEAFAYCEGLTEITIPASVLEVDGDIFWYAENLQNIYCEASEQPERWSISWLNGCDASVWFDGVLKIGYVGDYRVELFEAGVTILEYCGEDTIVVVPDTIMDLPVVAIGSYAFEYCDTITSVTLPETVVLIDSRAFDGCSALTEITIPETVNHIGYSAFGNCDVLQNIYCEAASRPEGWDGEWAEGCGASVWFDGVLTIGTIDGFRFEIYDGCVDILGYFGDESNLVIPAELNGYPVVSIGAGAFVECSTLETVLIPEGVVYIGYEAFAYNENLTEVTIPASVTDMDSDVFWYCQNLQNIYCKAAEQPKGWSDGWTNECDANVWFDGVLKQGVVGDYRIRIEDENNVTILNYLGDDTEVIIPAEIEGVPVTAIGARVFSDCYFIQSIVIPDSIKSIGRYAFAWCYELTELTVPASVEYVDAYAFGWCESLQNLYLEEGVDISSWNVSWNEGVLANVWLGETLLTMWDGDYFVFVEDGNTTILGYYGGETDLVIPAQLGGGTVIGIGANVFGANYMIETVVLPETVVEIASGAFYNCGNLRSIELSDSLVIIGDRAFAECYSLTEITIPGSVAYIGEEAFAFCYELHTVVLENGVQELGYAAFAACNNLQSITLPSTMLAIGGYCFAETALTEITIPEGVKYIGEGAFSYIPTLETIYCEVSQPLEFWDPNWLYGCEADVVWDIAPCEHQNLRSDVIKEPGCEENGCERVFCEDCGEFLHEGEISARGHSYDENGICVDCGAEKPVADVVYGDVNGDGKITGTDVTRLLRYIANRNPITGESTVEIGEGSDCNGDGRITGTDVTRLLRFIANRNPITGESTVTLGPSN